MFINRVSPLAETLTFSAHNGESGLLEKEFRREREHQTTNCSVINSASNSLGSVTVVPFKQGLFAFLEKPCV